MKNYPIISLDEKKIRLILPEQSIALSFGLGDIEQILKTVPPSEMAWETAIMTIEDGISPLQTILQNMGNYGFKVSTWEMRWLILQQRKGLSVHRKLKRLLRYPQGCA